MLCLIGIGLSSITGQNLAQRSVSLRPSPDTSANKSYSGLSYEQTRLIPSSWGVKSVLFNSTGTKLYALNLENMYISEFSQKSKKLIRVFSFKPTKSMGLDYRSHQAIPSFAEKPVEACFTHQDKILWVSLHNSGGIIPLLLDSVLLNKPLAGQVNKVVYLSNQDTHTRDTLLFPLIHTGKTPKVIAKTADNRYLLVSNWTSKTVSILKINDTLAPYGKKIATISTPAIPRGIAVDDQNSRTYVGIMGGNSIIRINHKNWKIEKRFTVPQNPRHLVTDTSGHLFVSFNSVSEIACMSTATGRILFTARTHAQPRTIALSGNQKFLFVTCYLGNKIDVFKVNPGSFSRIFSIDCPGKPVGIALYENQDTIEAWVGNYLAGHLNVFTFKKVN